MTPNFDYGRIHSCSRLSSCELQHVHRSHNWQEPALGDGQQQTDRPMLDSEGAAALRRGQGNRKQEADLAAAAAENAARLAEWPEPAAAAGQQGVLPVSLPSELAPEAASQRMLSCDALPPLEYE